MRQRFLLPPILLCLHSVLNVTWTMSSRPNCLENRCYFLMGQPGKGTGDGMFRKSCEDQGTKRGSRATSSTSHKKAAILLIDSPWWHSFMLICQSSSSLRTCASVDFHSVHARNRLYFDLPARTRFAHDDRKPECAALSWTL